MADKAFWTGIRITKRAVKKLRDAAELMADAWGDIDRCLAEDRSREINDIADRLEQEIAEVMEIHKERNS